MIKIYRKPGWALNPNDKIVNSVLARAEANGGHCPCHNTGHDTICPCSDYREDDVCHCSLYVKRKESLFVGTVAVGVPPTLREGEAIDKPSDVKFPPKRKEPKLQTSCMQTC